MKLLKLVEKVKPVGSSDEAILAQWIHAFSSHKEYFGLNGKITAMTIEQSLADAGFVDNGKITAATKKKYKIKSTAKKYKFKFIDLFAGIGGMRMAAENLGGACVFSSEFDKFAQDTYEYNYGETPFGDIKLIDEMDIPDHDLLLAGFPCQPFSYAGRCEGFEDQTRGTLFFDVLRILEEKNPKVVILENVKGFKSHNNGQTMHIALKALEEAGYYPEWKILNSFDYGVPQFRERWYCIATRKNIKINFPNGIGRNTILRDIIDQNNNDSSLSLSKFEKERIDFHFKSKELRVKHDSSKYAPNTKKGKHGVYSFQKIDGSLRFHVGDFAKTQIQEAFYACLDTYAPTIIANRTPKLWDIARKLSVKEASRLQGFPESFNFSVSNAQAYKQLGNSVSLPVIEALINSVVKSGGFK